MRKERFNDDRIEVICVNLGEENGDRKISVHKPFRKFILFRSSGIPLRELYLVMV